MHGEASFQSSVPAAVPDCAVGLLPFQAAKKPKHSLERLICVAAFASSVYSTIQRTQKPFKNMQNSTYELVYPEKGLRCIGEKVQCHPVCMQCLHVPPQLSLSLSWHAA